jgi:tRNA (guanine10-N2)-methyltransferase
MSTAEEPGFDVAAVSLGSKVAHFVAAGSVLPGRRRYLLVFLHRHLNFRLPEVEGLAEVAHGAWPAWGCQPGAALLVPLAHRAAAPARVFCPLTAPPPRPPVARRPAGSPTGADGLPAVVWELPAGGNLVSPFWYAHLPSEAVALYVGRHAMLVKLVVELWGEAPTWEELFAQVAAHPSEDKARYAADDQSFRFVVDAWARKVAPAEQVAVIETFEDCTRFRGPIRMRDPQHTFWVFMTGESRTLSLPSLEPRFYFGRELARGGARGALARFDLRSRRYLGPTSMDAQLAFIMAALACVRPGGVAFDPFAGTGSVLVAAAARGALTLGADIDLRVLRVGKRDAKGRPVNVWTNFQDYALPPPLGLLRCDLHRLPLRPGLEGFLASVVADPPYGVRAGGRKSRSVPGAEVRDRATHVASTAPYPLAECLRDLVDAAARLLEVGGRLVFWVPAAPGYYVESELPTHPAMSAPLANCEQLLGGRYSRRLVAMRKERAYDAAAAEAHYAALGPPRMAQDSMHELVLPEAGSETASEGGGGGRRWRPPSFRSKLV